MFEVMTGTPASGDAPAQPKRRALLIGFSVALLEAGLPGGVHNAAAAIMAPMDDLVPDAGFFALSQQLTEHRDLNPATAARMLPALALAAVPQAEHIGALIALAQQHAAPASRRAGLDAEQGTEPSTEPSIEASPQPGRRPGPELGAKPGLHTALQTAGSVAPSAQSLLLAAEQIGLKDLALAIVRAWYTGTVGLGDRAILLAYQEALMYRPVRDALTVPTYCNFGPLWWTGTPPDAARMPADDLAQESPAS
ncbi:sugar dehydrogenase complex small subunit [Alcaligenaceae bacterium C4P045]|nr:sugar dehydrogenase complex small subunit [Alcaligenaceae bacterium C4P045]